MEMTFDEYLKAKRAEKEAQWEREAKAEYERSVMEYERQKQLKREATYGKNPNYSGIRIINGVPYQLSTNGVSEVTRVEPVATKEQFQALTAAQRNELYEADKALFMRLNHGYPLEPDFDFMARAHGARLECIDFRQNSINAVMNKFGWAGSEYESQLNKQYDNLGEKAFNQKYGVQAEL